MTTRTKSKTSKSQGIDEARLAVTTAEKGVRDSKRKARVAKSVLKAARKASKLADKAAKKARKQARQGRKTVKTLLARQAKLKKRTVAKRDSLEKNEAAATGHAMTEVAVDAQWEPGSRAGSSSAGVAGSITGRPRGNTPDADPALMTVATESREKKK